MIIFNDLDDDLDLDLDDDFDLDLDIDDDFDEDDDLEESASDNNTELPSNTYKALTGELEDKLKEYKEKNLNLNDIKKDLLSTFNIEMKIFIDNNYPFKNIESKSLYRYRFIDSNILKPEQMEKINNIPFDHKTFDETDDFPVYYADEWLEYVADGSICESAGDDVSAMNKPKSPGMMKGKLKKQIDTQKKNYTSMVKLRDESINEFAGLADKVIQNRGENPMDLSNQVQTIVKLLTTINSVGLRVKILKSTISKIVKEYNSMADTTEVIEDSGLLESEHNALMEMAKICVGPRGNFFPFLIDSYFPVFILDRKLVIELIKEYSNLFPGFFYRKFLGIETEKVPYTAILPCYGLSGYCWDPIDPTNKESGRGKMVLPLYSMNKPEELVIEALADYYWNKNKTAAGSRWLEEGITGKYYMYHQDLKIQKKKGKDVKVIPDLKKSFLTHFKQWALEERIGRAKLSKELRQMFWFNIPFNIETREELAKKGFNYKTLWENDQRRTN